MEIINTVLLTLDGYLGASVWFPFILLGVGLFFTIYLRFPQVRFFTHAWAVLRGKYEKSNNPGDTTHFGALSTALSGTIGTGNIGGVGLAIYIGGPAALFWMWMTAFLGMATKMVEVSLSHKYRVKAAGGTMSGGPMYYMAHGLKMRWLATFFAIATVICSIGTGNLPQINNIATSVNASFGIAPIMTGAVLAVLLAMVIIGGIKRIAYVAAAIVPSMATIYLIGALSVIILNFGNIIPSFLSIFRDAFSGSAATGGFLGATFAFAFNRGVGRGLYSNEAGQGSAAIAHASAKTDEPISEGMVSLLEPFIDTLIICTITGLVILSSGAWTEKFENEFQFSDLILLDGIYQEQSEIDRSLVAEFIANGESDTVFLFSGSANVVNGILLNPDITILHARSFAEDVRFLSADELYNGQINIEEGVIQDLQISLRGKSLLHSAVLTTKAFGFGLFGEKGQYIVTISLVLFAFSTALAWSYYGDRAIIYLIGSKAVLPYRILYCFAFFIASFIDTTLVWNIAAVAIVLMTLPNLLGIMLMRKEMKTLARNYWEEYKDK